MFEVAGAFVLTSGFAYYYVIITDCLFIYVAVHVVRRFQYFARVQLHTHTEILGTEIKSSIALKMTRQIPHEPW